MGNFFKDITGMSDERNDLSGFVSMTIDPLDLTGKKSEWATQEATGAALAGQQAQLDFLREIDRVPRAYRDKALSELYLTFAGTPEEQQESINRAKASPLYQALISGREPGEESIMRKASATGGLRSGNIQGALYDYNTRLESDALLKAYEEQMSGLRGLAQIPDIYGSEIGRTMSGMGETSALGITGEAQSQQASREQAAGLGMGLLSLFV